MFSFFCGLWKYLFSKAEFHVLILGIDKAGKTTLLEKLKAIYSNLEGLPHDRIVPTVGLNIGCIELSNTKLVFWDLGGQQGPKQSSKNEDMVRGEKIRKEFAILLQRHQSAVVIQKQIRSRIAQKKFLKIYDASVMIQSVIRGWLVRRCSGDLGLLVAGGRKDKESDELLVKSSFLAELQRRVLKAEASLREKDEENDILHQRLQQYENRWSEYELKMKSMEEVWQKQMRSLQSSLSIAKKSLALDDSRGNSDASVNQNDNRDPSWDAASNFRNLETNGGRSMSAGLTVIRRMAEEFEHRSQVFGDDAKFLVEVKSGQTESGLINQKVEADV